MNITVNVPDAFAQVAQDMGMTPQALLTALASQEVMRHFNNKKRQNVESTGQSGKNLLLG